MDFNRIITRIFKFFSSIQLAIFILLSLGIMSATGTILEARYDTAYAQKVIYHSPYMYFIMALLCVNLIHVMIDRWPWRPHHAGFIFAHVGIIILIVGSLVTKIYGLDGTMSFDIGQKNRFVTVPETELAVYSTFGDGGYKVLYSTARDFFTAEPSAKKPFHFQAGPEKFQVVDYYNYALRESKIVETEDKEQGPAIRIQLQNDRVNVTQWLLRTRNSPYTEINLGPARVVFAGRDTPFLYDGGNIVLIRNISDTELTYEIFTASRKGQVMRGKLPLAEAIATGWMGLNLRLFKYIPHAEEKISFQKRQYPTGQTTPAIEVQHNGQSYWLGLNSTARIFQGDQALILVYRNRLVDVGFELFLERFEVGRYQGSRQAKSYESVVRVPNGESVKISMNEPLKYQGFTFYQASFQEDQMGEPTTSVLSVNRDPGRALKYFGSLLIVLGTLIMFYVKKYRVALGLQQK